MSQARGLLSVYYSRGTLVPRTCARAVVAPCGKACQGSAKSLHGPFQGRAKTKDTSQEDKDPARGACRAKEAGPRQEELAGTTKPKHQGPGGRSPPGRPNQGTPREARRGAPRAPAR